MKQQRSVSDEEREGLDRGRGLYPGRPFPPAVYGYEWTRFAPDWAHIGSLESRTATITVKRPGLPDTLQQVVQYKVPLKPPPEVLAHHAEMAKRAAKGVTT